MPPTKRGRNPKPTEAMAPPLKAASDPEYMLSLERGLAVIRAFGEKRTPLSIAEVARIAGISRGAARRCLHTLAVLGYASGTGGTYSLEANVLTLGYAYLHSTPVALSAQSAVERVMVRLEETSALGVLQGDEVVYLACAAVQRILSGAVVVGSRRPAYCTSLGRVLLAAKSDADVAGYLGRLTPVRHTPNTIIKKPLLRAEIERVRERGYALVDQEIEIGVRAVAVPVRRPGGEVVAALSVITHASRMDLARMQRDFLPVLRSNAEEIGHSLGLVLR
jgi:IclR family pca regulon transcriptional regulator